MCIERDRTKLHKLENLNMKICSLLILILAMQQLDIFQNLIHKTFLWKYF